MTPYYSQDGITIYHGDCREVAPLLALEFDAVIADPPYAQTSLDWDRWPDGWPSALAVTSRSMWCFGSLRMFLDRRDEFSAWKLSQDIVWEKHNGSSFHADRFRRVHEQACHFYHGDWDSIYKQVPVTNDATARTVRRQDRPAHMGHIGESRYTSVDGGPRLMRSVMFSPSMHGKASNETQKPERIVAPLIEYACPPGGVLLSAFCGSGTDLIAARLSGRLAVGCDVRESECETAARKLQSMLPMEFSA